MSASATGGGGGGTGSNGVGGGGGGGKCGEFQGAAAEEPGLSAMMQEIRTFLATEGEHGKVLWECIVECGEKRFLRMYESSMRVLKRNQNFNTATDMKDGICGKHEPDHAVHSVPEELFAAVFNIVAATDGNNASAGGNYCVVVKLVKQRTGRGKKRERKG